MTEGDNMSFKEAVAQEMSKAAPPATVGSLVLCGIPLSDVVLVATLVYTALQVFFLLRDKWWRQRGKSKE